MKYAVVTYSGAMIYIPSFMKIGSISLLSFFQNMGSRLEMQEPFVLQKKKNCLEI
jgi:hypothetical protein